ncbi:hypothetical protein LX32DRAFT_687247, partial [Colletotrichum zoysiae]
MTKVNRVTPAMVQVRRPQRSRWSRSRRRRRRPLPTSSCTRGAASGIRLRLHTSTLTMLESSENHWLARVSGLYLVVGVDLPM